jgi:hypothetical protein
LKPSFNKSGQSCPQAQRKALITRQKTASEKKGRVMATITSASLSHTADNHDGRSTLFAEFRGFWRQFFARAFNPYRPELHYMRGPGPAWRAKHMAVSPAVQTMVAEIRAARVHRPARS